MPFMESLKSILGTIFLPFKWAYDFVVKTLTVWMTLLGLACVVVGGLKYFGLSEDYARVLTSVGTAILVGGVSGVLLKSLQYSGVFKKELNKIIYGANDSEEERDLVRVFREEMNYFIYGIKDPQERTNFINTMKEGLVQVTFYDEKYLQTRRDLSDLWKRVSEIVYVSRFPDISRNITERIATEYFPSDDDFYYSEFKENVNIRFYDAEKKYIVARETINLTIKPVHKLQSVNWVFGIELDKLPTDDVTSYKLIKLKVCGEDYKVGDPPTNYSPEVKISDDKRLLWTNLDITLEGEAEYPVEIVQEKVYDLDLNQERGVTSSRFIKEPELHVIYPTNELEAKFVPVGTREDAYKPHGEALMVIWNVYEGLIFPNQGYRLLLRRRH